MQHGEPILTEARWKALRSRIRRSTFRSGFHLSDDESEYLRDRGMDLIRAHAGDFVRQRLAPAEPRNDGRQTPIRGHPVFVAQHATATCCRKCLWQWHRIPMHRPLRERDVEYVMAILLRWLAESMDSAPVPAKSES